LAEAPNAVRGETKAGEAAELVAARKDRRVRWEDGIGALLMAAAMVTGRKVTGGRAAGVEDVAEQATI